MTCRILAGMEIKEPDDLDKKVQETLKTKKGYRGLGRFDHYCYGVGHNGRRTYLERRYFFERDGQMYSYNAKNVLEGLGIKY